MLLSGAWGKMIHEKPEAKNLVTLSLYHINHDEYSAKFNKENWTGGWLVVHENNGQHGCSGWSSTWYGSIFGFWYSMVHQQQSTFSYKETCLVSCSYSGNYN
jgi:hypothetical protein